MAPTQRRETDQDMERKADDEVKRDPWQIEQCDRPHARQKRPQTVEMAERLKPVTTIARFKRQTNKRVIDAVADCLIEARSRRVRGSGCGSGRGCQAPHKEPSQ